MRFVAAIVFIALIMCVQITSAAEVIPDSYVAPPGDQGWLTQYLDETGCQLTDGVHCGPWSAEEGYPGYYDYDYYPWYGWDERCHEDPLTITFNFLQNVSLSEIQLFTGKDTSGSIYIPQKVEILARDAGGAWFSVGQQSYDDSLFTDGYRHTLIIDINVMPTNEIQMIFTPTNGRWIILNEVDFLGAPVPEPSSILALILGIGGFGGMIYRKRK